MSCSTAILTRDSIVKLLFPYGAWRFKPNRARVAS
jgi:hypothetical protein